MYLNTSNRSSNNNYDILIVGGGPAGISTWLHLHKYAPDLAAKTLLIEKEKYPRDKLCGGALLNIGQDILKKLQIHLDIPCVPIHKSEYRYQDDVFCYKEQNFVKIIRRIEFDHMLANIAVTRGLQLSENNALINFFYNKKSLLVQTTKDKYKVKTLIGADGATSIIRNQMNAKVKPRFAPALEVFHPVNPTVDQEFENHSITMDFTPMSEGLQGYVWHFPCMKDGEAWMNHGICDININKKKPRVHLNKIFTKELQARKMNIKSNCWSGYPIPWFAEVPCLSQPNILLVGDAAGIEPLIGGGIHLSLLYGDVAASTLINAFQNDDFSLKEYMNNFQTHFVGKYIRKFTYLASEVYCGRMNILDVMKKNVTA